MLHIDSQTESSTNKGAAKVFEPRVTEAIKHLQYLGSGGRLFHGIIRLCRKAREFAATVLRRVLELCRLRAAGNQSPRRQLTASGTTPMKSPCDRVRLAIGGNRVRRARDRDRLPFGTLIRARLEVCCNPVCQLLASAGRNHVGSKEGAPKWWLAKSLAEPSVYGGLRR